MGQKTYVGNTDLLFIVQLIHSEFEKYVKAVEGKGLSEEDFTTELKAKLDGIDISQYATIASPALTGIPTAPTASAGSNNEQIANTEYVTSSIASALAGFVGIDFQKYDTFTALPVKGVKGIIYLIPNGAASPNVNDEYFWDGEKYELFGSTQVNLTGYVKDTDLVEISADDIQAAWDSVFNP